VLIGLGILQRRHQPHVELVTDLCDGCLGNRCGDDRVGAQWQMRPMLLDGAKRLNDDAAIGEQFVDLRTGEVGEVALGRCHGGTLPPAPLRQNDDVTAPDYDAMVIGAGHNGLVCAAYLARAGLRTLLVEARTSVGGTASSESFGGGTVNICNCDHITFRTTPVIEELGLADHGLRYIDIDPAQHNMVWDGEPPWTIFHEVEQTIDSLAGTYPADVDGYRRYLKAALPAARMVLDNANDPPTLRSIGKKVIARHGHGATTLLRWSRRSAADVMRSFFTEEALRGPAMVTGPMVWGVSPELAGTGLGALSYALRHVARVGRPVGGSGMVPETLRRAFVAAGGTLLLNTKVAHLTCDERAIRGMVCTDGTEVTSPIVVSACNPHDTFLTWLKNPPSQAASLVERWRKVPNEDGYESKVDAIVDVEPTLTTGEPLGATTVISPSLAEIHHGYSMMSRGQVLAQPGMLVNSPSALDRTLVSEDRHVFSLEVLYTPYKLAGGWPNSDEPQRWLDQVANVLAPGFLDSLVTWRAMTPETYERDFHLPHGHATSFVGGPLAALHNKSPELTRYETAVKGLYLTGAATFPGAGIWGASGRNAALRILARNG
jgi:beta-carotene ketolase (CrtO type)